MMVASASFDGKAPLKFVQALKSMDEAGCEVDWEFVKHYDCAGARTVLARKALAGGYDKVLWLDSDVVVPADALKNLLESKQHMVFGVYPRKSDPTSTVLYGLEGAGINASACLKLADVPPKVFPIKGGGLGCCLMDVSVLRDVEFPWFVFEEREDGTSKSEDIYFCEKAYWAGIDCDCDGRVRCGHVIESEVR